MKTKWWQKMVPIIVMMAMTIAPLVVCTVYLRRPYNLISWVSIWPAAAFWFVFAKRQSHCWDADGGEAGEDTQKGV